MGTVVSREEGDLKKPLIKLGMDALFFVILVLPVYIFNLTEVVTPTVRGFFCSDNSIQYPYRKSTVPSLTLFLIGIPVVIAATCIIECCHYRLYNRAAKRGVFHPVVVALYRVFGFFIVGATINQILTDTAKLTVGRLRPMFLDVCLPSVACNSSLNYQYILDYTCTRTEYPGNTAAEFKEMQFDIRKSFPSGHASFSMYCAVFAVIYLELRFKYRPARMFKICCQALALSAAVWCCCTRYIDNKHHPTDIIFGAIFGSSMGIFAVYLYYRSLTFPSRKIKRIAASCSVSPSSVINRSVTNNHEVEPETNGITNELTMKVEDETL